MTTIGISVPAPRSDRTYQAVSVDLYPGDRGVFMTDGVTETLEGGSVSLRDALTEAARSVADEPAALCRYRLRVAGEGPGPDGVGKWQDDRTALAFRVLSR